MGTIQHIIGAPSVRTSSPPAQLFINSRFGVCSSSTVAVTGDETVANGAFTSDTGSWEATNCTIASVAGGKAGNCLEITRTGEALQWVTQTITLVPGHTYKVCGYSKQGTSGAGTSTINILDASDDSLIYNISGAAPAAWGDTENLIGYFRAWVASIKIHVEKSDATAGTMLFDSISVKEFVPSYTGADYVAPEGWNKDSTLDIYRQSDTDDVDSGGSQYSLLLTPSAAGDWLRYSPLGPNTYDEEEYYSRFRGADMVMKMSVKTSTASHARLKMYDGSTTKYSNYHTGGGAWEDLEVTMDFSATLTCAAFEVVLEQAAGDVYICKPMLSYGTVIGSGIWQPIPYELIELNAPQASLLFGGTTACSDNAGTHIDIEGDSYGVVPRGTRKIYSRVNVRDSGSAGGDAWFKLRHHNAGGEDWHAVWSCGGLANDMYHYGCMQWCQVNLGVIEYLVEATGSLTLDVDNLHYCAVQY